MYQQEAQPVPGLPARLPGHVPLSHHILFPQDCSAELPTNTDRGGRATLQLSLDLQPPPKALWPVEKSSHEDRHLKTHSHCSPEYPKA